MAEPFLGEIRLMSFDFAPKGWARCDGALLPINQNQALFALLGTTFGGNGQTTFGLPDMRGRVPVHVGAGLTQGAKLGEAAHTLSMQEMPQHHHVASATANNTDAGAIAENALLCPTSQNLYGPPASLTTLLPATVANAGGSQPHENRQPFLTINFCVALQGIFPSQN